jgi:hypothetical protein
MMEPISSGIRGKGQAEVEMFNDLRRVPMQLFARIVSARFQ